MTLQQFGRQIHRGLIVERAGKASRCFYRDVMFAENTGVCGVTTTIIGCGPNQQRMLEDFVQKIRGKVARVFDGLGAYEEFPVPKSLTP